MLGSTVEDLAQFLHQEERLCSVRLRAAQLIHLPQYLQPCPGTCVPLLWSSYLREMSMQGSSGTHLMPELPAVYLLSQAC